MTNESLFAAIEVVQLPVKDVRAAEQWYVEKLGLKKTFEMPEAKIVAFDLGDASLGLFQVDDAPASPPPARAYPMLRPRDLDKAHEILRARGVHAEPIESRGPYRWFRFVDPDGNPIEALARTG